jgi:hypothetical protein
VFKKRLCDREGLSALVPLRSYVDAGDGSGLDATVGARVRGHSRTTGSDRADLASRFLRSASMRGHGKYCKSESKPEYRGEDPAVSDAGEAAHVSPTVRRDLPYIE